MELEFTFCCVFFFSIYLFDNSSLFCFTIYISFVLIFVFIYLLLHCLFIFLIFCLFIYFLYYFSFICFVFYYYFLFICFLFYCLFMYQFLPFFLVSLICFLFFCLFIYLFIFYLSVWFYLSGGMAKIILFLINSPLNCSFSAFYVPKWLFFFINFIFVSSYGRINIHGLVIKWVCVLVCLCRPNYFRVCVIAT